MFDPTLASPFRLEWLVEADRVMQDDLARAIAEKAEAILRAARFVGSQRDESDVEVRVWIEGAAGPGCVSVTWEPGARAFGFHVLDESLRERLACIVFRDLPSVSAEASDAQVADILAALSETLHTRRVEVVETTSVVDPGVER